MAIANCQKCGKEFENYSKHGLKKCCSKECSHSRVFSDEAKHKKRLAQLGRKPKPPRDKAAWAAKIKESHLQKYLAAPFEELGCENRRRRVFEEQDHRCNRCGLLTWLEQPIPLELEHKDGNNKNNLRENLEGLCPNCHAQTHTWRGRNANRTKDDFVSDETLLQHVQASKNIRQGLLNAGLTPKGKNYNRVKKLLTS